MPLTKMLYLFFSFLLGSIPFGYLIFFFTEKRDIRTVGSGNIGATNVLRSKGRVAGIATLLFDIGKGALPVWYGLRRFDLPVWAALGGAAVVLGHVFSLFLKGKGGKGVGSFVGVLLALQWPALIVFLLVFLAVLLMTHFVSLAAILAALAGFFAVLFLAEAEVALVILGLVILVVVRHRSNIQRLIDGKENRFQFRKNG